MKKDYEGATWRDDCPEIKNAGEDINMILIDAAINTEIMKVNARIDRIIEAHDSCKKLKGL